MKTIKYSYLCVNFHLQIGSIGETYDRIRHFPDLCITILRPDGNHLEEHTTPFLRRQ